MRHRDGRAPRPLVACAFHVELLEGRRLLSGMGQPSVPQPPLAKFGAGADVAPGFGALMPGPRDGAIARGPGARSAEGPEGAVATIDHGGASFEVSKPTGPPAARDFGPLGGPAGGPVVSPRFNVGPAIAIVSVLTPTAPRLRLPIDGPFGPGDRSPRDSVSTASRPSGPAAPDGPAATAKDQATSPEAVAIVINAGAAVGIAAGGGAPLGNAIGIAAAGASRVGTAGIRHGGPVFVGNPGGRSASDRAGAISGSRSDEGRPFDLVPLFAGIHRDEMQPMADTLSVGGATGFVEVPPPRRSDLLTDFIPFDRTSLEHAIDRFLDRFEDLGAELTRSPGPTILFTEVMAVAVALLASKVTLGLLGRSRDDEADWAGADAGANLAGFSGLPDPWGMEEV
jgi:hypothetical protein